MSQHQKHSSDTSATPKKRTTKNAALHPRLIPLLYDLTRYAICQATLKAFLAPRMAFLTFSRFVINCPEEERSSFARICFQFEQALWYYEDFYRASDPTLPAYNIKQFVTASTSLPGSEGGCVESCRILALMP